MTQTGLTTSLSIAGIAPGATQAFLTTDPRQGVQSTSVQIQNKTPVNLSVLIGADSWSVTASQSTTLPLVPNSGITITVTNDTGIITSNNAVLTLVWMLDNQEPPQPDGPLTSSDATGSGGGGEVNYALEVGGNLQTLKNNFSTFSNTGQQAVYYDSDTTIGNASGVLMMGSQGGTPGTATPGSARVIQTDNVGRLVLSPTVGGAVTIVSPLDGAGNVKVDVEAQNSNLALETGGNLAKLASIVVNGGVAAPTPVAQVGGIQQGTGFLEPLVLDSSQNLLVNVQSLPNIQLSSQGTPGAANPTAALQVAGSDGTDLRTLATDAGGQLKVLVEGGTGSPITLAAPSNTSSISASSLQVKNAAGTLYGVTGYSSIAQFFQLLDATSLVSGTTVPKVSVPIPAAGGFALDYGDRGRAFGTGIYAAYSSTQAVFTTGTAGTIDAQFV